MDILLVKLVSQLVYPLSLSLFLSMVAGLLLLARRRWSGGLLLFAALAWLYLWSIPVFSDRVRTSLEQRFPPSAVDTLQPAGAIVVLGGGIQAAMRPRVYPDLQAAADRLWHAARLYHAGKAPLLIVSGGPSIWAEADAPAESEAMGTFLTDLGVPPTAILFESRSRNTYENAVQTKELLQQHQIDNIILVTSALHMPRAVQIFRATGIDFTPAPTDYEVYHEPLTLLHWLPRAMALEGATRGFKEYLGMTVFWLGGR